MACKYALVLLIDLFYQRQRHSSIFTLQRGAENSLVVGIDGNLQLMRRGLPQPEVIEAGDRMTIVSGKPSDSVIRGGTTLNGELFFIVYVHRVPRKWLRKSGFHGNDTACAVAFALPVRSGIDIASINKFYNLTNAQDGVPGTVHEPYKGLMPHAPECIACGKCKATVVFGVPIIASMRRAVKRFG